jgi:hypothetical protein
MEAVASIEPGKMKWEDFRQSAEWINLTPAQQAWLVSFFASDDIMYATRVAFPNCAERNRRSMAWQIERTPRIVAASNLWRGRTEKEIFLQELEKTIRASEDGSVAKVRAMSLYARLKFDLETLAEPEESGKKTPAASAELRFKVGDPIIVDGVKRRVTAVDEDAHVTDVTDEAVE